MAPWTVAPWRGSATAAVARPHIHTPSRLIVLVAAIILSVGLSVRSGGSGTLATVGRLTPDRRSRITTLSERGRMGCWVLYTRSDINTQQGRKEGRQKKNRRFLCLYVERWLSPSRGTQYTVTEGAFWRDRVIAVSQVPIASRPQARRLHGRRKHVIRVWERRVVILHFWDFGIYGRLSPSRASRLEAHLNAAPSWGGIGL